MQPDTQIVEDFSDQVTSTVTSTATSTDQPVTGPGVTAVPFIPPILIGEPADNPSGPLPDAPVMGPGVDVTPPLVDRAREAVRVETPARRTASAPSTAMQAVPAPSSVAMPLTLVLVAIGLITAFVVLDRSR